MSRLNISIKNELIKALEEDANKKGKTISSILSEAANLYMEAEKVGLRSSDVLKSFRIIEIMGEVNAVPVPSILLDNMIKLSLKDSENEVMDRWVERGQVLGNILKSYAKTFKDLSEFVSEYRFLLPTDMFEIELDGHSARIVLSGVGYSLEAAKCTSEGLRGLLAAYGYEVDNVETSEGFVKIIAKEKAN